MMQIPRKQRRIPSVLVFFVAAFWVVVAVVVVLFVAQYIRSRRDRSSYFVRNTDGTYSIRSKSSKESYATYGGRIERMSEPAVRHPRVYLRAHIPSEAFESAEDEVWITGRLFARTKHSEGEFQLRTTYASRVLRTPYDEWHSTDPLTLDFEDYEVRFQLWDGEPERTSDGFDFIEDDTRMSESVTANVVPYRETSRSTGGNGLPLWNPFDWDFWQLENFPLWIYLAVFLAFMGAAIFAVIWLAS